MRFASLPPITFFLACFLSPGALRADDPKEVVQFKIAGIIKRFTAERFDGAMYYAVRDDGKRIFADILLTGSNRPVTAEEIKDLATLDCPLMLELSPNVELTPGAWKEFASLKRLENLHIWQSAVSDLGYDSLAKMPGLRTLTLTAITVSEHGYRSLAKMRGLRTLTFGGALTIDDLKGLRTLTQLRELDISGSIPEDGWPALMKLNLTSLELGEPVDGDLKGLASQKNLKSLSFEGVDNLTAHGFEEIAALEHLTSLRLFRADVPNSALKSISHLRNLKLLSLNAIDVPDASAAYLGQLQELTDLDLSSCKLSAGVIAKIASLPKLERLDLSYTNLNDKGLLVLQRSLNLRRLHLTRTAVTDEGVERFETVLPAGTVSRFK